jgi:hypothetical protein
MVGVLFFGMVTPNETRTEAACEPLSVSELAKETKRENTDGFGSI